MNVLLVMCVSGMTKEDIHRAIEGASRDEAVIRAGVEAELRAMFDIHDVFADDLFFRIRAPKHKGVRRLDDKWFCLKAKGHRHSLRAHRMPGHRTFPSQ